VALTACVTACHVMGNMGISWSLFATMTNVIWWCDIRVQVIGGVDSVCDNVSCDGEHGKHCCEELKSRPCDQQGLCAHSSGMEQRSWKS